jgi:hypothetical protein
MRRIVDEVQAEWAGAHIWPARLHAALHVHRELAAQKQVLNGDDARGLQCHDGEPQHVRQQLTGDFEQRNHAPIVP